MSSPRRSHTLRLSLHSTAIKIQEELFKDTDFVDVRVVVDTEVPIELWAHRNVLASASPVLRSMLSAEMWERLAGEIHLNISLEAWNILKRMVYLSELEVAELDSATFDEVARASDAYDVATGVSLCIQFSRWLMSNENATISVSQRAVDVFWVMRRLCDELVCFAELDSLLLEFLLVHYSFLMQTEEFVRQMALSDWRWSVAILRRHAPRLHVSPLPITLFQGVMLWRESEAGQQVSLDDLEDLISELGLADAGMASLTSFVEPCLLATGVNSNRLLCPIFRAKAWEAETLGFNKVKCLVGKARGRSSRTGARRTCNHPGGIRSFGLLHKELLRRQTPSPPVVDRFMYRKKEFPLLSKLAEGDAGQQPGEEEDEDEDVDIEFHDEADDLDDDEDEEEQLSVGRGEILLSFQGEMTSSATGIPDADSWWVEM